MPTINREKLLTLAKKEGTTKADVYLFQIINELQNQNEELRNEIAEIKKIATQEFSVDSISEKTAMKLATTLARLEKGDKGDMPSEEELTPLITKLIPPLIEGKVGERGEKGDKGDKPSEKELVTLIKPLIPEPIKGDDGKDGKDADEEAIIEKLEKNLPQFGEQFRDGLELLQGDERLSISAIKGLRKALEKAQKLGGSGGFNYGSLAVHLITAELVGTGDGSTTDFDLNNVPGVIERIVVGSGDLFETDDWTRSGKTISFITAPPNGAKIRAWYRI